MTCHMPLGEMWSSPFPLGAAHAWQAEVLFAECMDDDSALMQDLVSCRLGRGNGNAEENHSSDTLQLLLSNKSGTPRTLHRGSLPSRQTAAIDILSPLPRNAYTVCLSLWTSWRTASPSSQPILFKRDQPYSEGLAMPAMGRRVTWACNAGEELFTCYKASTSSCSEADLEDRLIRWGFPSPQPDALQGDWMHEHPIAD